MRSASVLSPSELAELTGRQQPAAQVRALNRMQIRAYVVHGRVIVLREWLGKIHAAAPAARPVLHG
jgi:hypothetical protein